MKLPSYSISRIMKLKKKLKAAIELEYHGYAYMAEGFDNLVNHISSLLPKVDRDVVWASLRTYAGVPLLDPQLEELSWRLAGNLKRLQDGIVVPPWSSLVEDEWVPVQVQYVERYRIPWGKKATNSQKAAPTRKAMTLHLKVFGGYPAGTQLTEFMTDGSGFFNRVAIGFSAYANDPTDPYREPKKVYPMTDVSELTGMRFMVYLSAEALKNGRNFELVQCTSSLRKWNRDLMKKRQREGFTCPFNFPYPDNPCYACHKGRDSCPAACHRLTYTIKHCVKCNKQAYHDPERPGQVCNECLNNTVRKGS